MGKFVLKVNENGASFNLKAGNGEIIGVSERYSSEDAALNGIESVKRSAPEANIEDQTVANPVEQKHPKFEIYRDKKGEFRFRLKARNGEIILASEGYTAKPSCKKGIASVVKNSSSETVKK
ncbi:MAG: YegP family protein [Erysipelotrichaceae bacterium]|nr:YegP family protein [Erysipelotrichaceae bacterium]